MLGVRAVVLWRRQARRYRGWSSPGGELLDLTSQASTDTNQSRNQLGTGALRRWGAEHRFGVLETGVTAQRDTAKTEHREQADARFHAASTEYSEHRSIVGTVQ